MSCNLLDKHALMQTRRACCAQAIDGLLYLTPTCHEDGHIKFLGRQVLDGTANQVFNAGTSNACRSERHAYTNEMQLQSPGHAFPGLVRCGTCVPEFVNLISHPGSRC